jgi:2-polyprenyl-3-methyl-5-hydroxy-6-metoxy-1,4-benzoquinol methylase
MVTTRRLPGSEVAAIAAEFGWQAPVGSQGTDVVFEHERIPFPSYPYEWPPQMLWEAGRLTLDLALASLADGNGLKDATPYNILYRGADPVFIDITSFEPRSPGDPVWNPYGQFVRTFLLPLLVNRRWGIRLADIFMTHRDGLEPEEVYRLSGLWDRFKPQMLSLVSMPTWLRGKASAEGQELYRPQKLHNAEKAKFILESLLRQLRRSLDRVKPSSPKASVWSDYMSTHSYSEPAFAAKQQFVQATLQELKPARVLDVGANTGHFSALAARGGARVVAVDLDPVCVGSIWLRARAEKLDILPLVVDLARPSPALGWQYCECPSFLDRARGAFDAVLMLAVLHHLMVTERVPLPEILRLASELTTSVLIIEFVAPQDEMFRRLTRGREELHASFDEKVFERACLERFEILKSLPVPGAHRRLYCLKRKPTAA